MPIDSCAPSPEAAFLSDKHTIYVLVRRDIPVAQQLVQSSHAAAEAGRRFYRREHGIASLIVLSVATIDGLHSALRHLQSKGIEVELFHEPDFGIGDSALATRPLSEQERRHLMGWPLWREPAFPDAHLSASSTRHETAALAV